MSAQVQVVASVARRGYLNGFTDDELAARQIVKLAEELGELASTVEVDDPHLGYFIAELVRVGRQARVLFDIPSLFVGATVHSGPAASELADCAVVMAVAAHALQIPDIMAAAQEKALQDEARGVRNGK